MRAHMQAVDIQWQTHLPVLGCTAVHAAVLTHAERAILVPACTSESECASEQQASSEGPLHTSGTKEASRLQCMAMAAA